MVLAVLLVVHFSVGLLVSPFLSKLIVEKINEYSGSKIYIEQARVWPLTLSFSLKNLKVFEPENENQKIAEIQDASVHLSVLGLLSKRAVVSSIYIRGATVNLRGEPDGSFNLQKLTQPKKAGITVDLKKPLEAAIRKKDWAGRAYDLLKKKLSKDTLEKQKTRGKEITKAVTDLPKGRRVSFKAADSYLFEVKKLILKDASLDLKSQDNRSIQIDKARIELRDVAYDPELGSRLGRAEIAGDIKNADVPAGSLKFFYRSSLPKAVTRGEFYFVLKDVNLDAVRFIYESSLPVEIVKGTLNLESKSTFTNDTLDSLNTLSLSNHELKAKGAGGSSDVLVPLPVLCEVLNTINPVNLNFTISGTADKPQFGGFTKSLMELVKPNLKNVGEVIKSEVIKRGIAGFTDKASQKEAPQQGAQDVINSLQSIFGTKNKESNK
jgi:hypothetical protein